MWRLVHPEGTCRKHHGSPYLSFLAGGYYFLSRDTYVPLLQSIILEGRQLLLKRLLDRYYATEIQGSGKALLVAKHLEITNHNWLLSNEVFGTMQQWREFEKFLRNAWQMYVTLNVFQIVQSIEWLKDITLCLKILMNSTKGITTFLYSIARKDGARYRLSRRIQAS